MQYHGPTPTPLPTAEPHEELIRAELALVLKRNEPLRIGAHSLMAIAVVVMTRSTTLPVALTIWLALFLGHLGYGAQRAWTTWQQAPQARDTGRRLYAVTRTEAINGLFWSVCLLMMVLSGSLMHRQVAMVVVLIMGACQLPLLAAHKPALFAVSAVPMLTALAVSVLGDGPFSSLAPVIVSVWFVLNANVAMLMHRTLRESIRARLRATALASDLQVQTERAVALGRSRSRMLAAASHDLRQPVHALALFVGALRLRPGPAEAERLIEHMHGTVDAMAAMFDTLLDLSKLDADMVHPQPQTLTLRQLLARVVDEQGAQARAKGLRFELRAWDTADALVCTDPTLFERLLRNLLSNAVRYTPRGGIVVSARARAGGLLIRIADSGIGIPAARQRQIFDEYVQLNAAGEEKGLGLGLAIVRRLSLLLGVRVTLRSRPGRGTVVTLHIPLASSGAASLKAARLSPSARSGLLPGDLVLVIDDDPSIRVAMAALLSGWGCQVLTAPGLEELQPQLASLQVAPRLILCDHQLRGEACGASVIEQLRSDFNDDVPAILITGDTAPESLRQAAASGLPLLHKPVGEGGLREAIQATLKQHGGAAALAIPPQAVVAFAASPMAPAGGRLQPRATG